MDGRNTHRAVRDHDRIGFTRHERELLKSMRTASSHRRKGVAKQLLQHLLAEAKRRGYTRVSLEMGSMDFFLPAPTLYASVGFAYCPPFADYRADPNSVFMTKAL
jgi:putative acetyltransferase